MTAFNKHYNCRCIFTGLYLQMYSYGNDKHDDLYVILANCIKQLQSEIFNLSSSIHEDYNVAKYNITEVNNRTKLNVKCRNDTVTMFCMQLYIAKKVIIDKYLSEFTCDTMQEILLYSNQWYNFCNTLGPFAYLISDEACTIDLIEQFEEKMDYPLLLNIRVSILICDYIQHQLIADCMCRNFQECVILPIAKWKRYGNSELGDDIHTYNFDNKLDYMFNKCIDTYKDLGLIDDLCIHHQRMISIGICCANVHVGYAILISNIFDNKLLTEVINLWSLDIDREIFDFDDWFINPYFMYEIHRCVY